MHKDQMERLLSLDSPNGWEALSDLFAERDRLQRELASLETEPEQAVAALRAADSLLDGIRDHDHEKLGVFCFSHTNPVHLHVKDVLKRLDGGGGV